MLAARRHFRRAAAPRRQRGVTLMVTLIVLVSMLLAIVGLLRSVDSTNVIAGNLSFKEASVSSGDPGIEAAIAWLEANSANNNLWLDHAQAGYHSFVDPPPGPPGAKGWDDWWTTVWQPSGVVTLPADAAGNTVSYIIHRICPGPGNPAAAGNVCATSTQQVAAADGSSSRGAGQPPLQSVTQQFYRITVRIQGPRNTVSYVQAEIVL